MTEYKNITLKTDNHITVVSLNRPDVCNALNHEILLEIEHCALAFRDDPNTRVVIFTGAGRHFSAGADLNELRSHDDDTLWHKRQRLRAGERVMRALLGIDQITISAWNGGAIGGGGCIAIATDFRIGGADCFLYYPEIDLGLNLMWQSLPRTVRLVGEARALRLTVGGERVFADTLLAWGLLEEVVPNDALLERATQFAQRYASKAPIAAQMIKRSVNAIGGHLDQAFMHMDVDQHVLVSLTRDHKAAVDAYMEKREAKFTGD